MKTFRKIALWIFVALLSLGQLQRIELANTPTAIYFHDVFIIFWIFHIFFTNPIAFGKYILEYFKNNKKIQLFIYITAFSLIINLLQNFDNILILYICRLITYVLFGFSLAFLIKEKNIDLEYFKFQTFSVGLFSLFLGFLQFIFIKDTRFLAILGWDDHYARLIGPYFDPGFTGIIFLITLMVGLSSEYLKNKKLQLFLILFFIWGIILTFSRASYLATITSFATFSVLKIKNLKNQILLKKIGIGTLVFFLMILLAPKPWGEGVNLLRTSTITARISAATQQIQKLSFKTVVIGNGLFSEKNSLTYSIKNNSEISIPSHSRVPDNIFLNIFLSTGIFGLIIFIILLNDWGKAFLKRNIYLFAIFVGLLIHTQFSNSVLQPFVLLLFLSALSVLQKPTN